MASYIRHPLDTERNTGHLSYRIAGLFFWLVMVFVIVGIFLYPDIVLWVGRIVAFYTLARLTLTVVFFLVALGKTHKAEKKWKTGGYQKTFDSMKVYHAVLIPNVNEPIEIIRRTLKKLALQQDAKKRIFVVLAMEDLELDADKKATQIIREYGKKFLGITYSLHPAGLPGEILGKGSNQAWAARCAKNILVEKMGIPIENIIITSCDVDSLFHTFYFSELTLKFIEDDERYVKFWQAPLVYYNNIWDLPVSLRMITYFIDAVQYSDLANPLANAFPISTYSFSMKLAESINFWDTGVISEDYNTFLRAFFGTKGKTRLVPIFLPTTADSVKASTVSDTWKAFYNQQLRHAFGAADIGYILQQYWKNKKIPSMRKFWMLLKMSVDYLFVSLAGFIIPIATVLAIINYKTLMVVAIPGIGIPEWVFLAVNSLWGITALGLWIADRLNAPAHRSKWKFMVLIQEVLMLLVFPFLTLGFEAIPVIQALTMLMLGRTMVYKTASKSSEVDI
jgi:hypothetical protein